MSATAAATVRALQKQHASWPYGELDVESLRLNGWRPTPVRDFIVKVHERCNLACDYCYVYESEDLSWRDRPAIMSPETWRTTVEKIHRHVRRHGTTRIRVILHGGEPMLLGAARIGELAADLRATLEPGCDVEVGMQTNGVLLNERALTHLRRHRIKVGISIDGTRADHDRHRVFRNGNGSFDKVSAALELLRRPENRPCFAGLLCTVAPDADPVETYATLRSFDPPLINFLLPHANWAHPPYRPGGAPTAYGDWLVQVFDIWYSEHKPPGVHLFEDVITLLLGGRGSSEQIGLSPAALVVIESDGMIEQADSLKTAYAGAPVTGLSIHENEIDEIFTDPGVVARQLGVAALSAQCFDCPIRDVCGGGHYAHRYRAGVGFRNPSVYCEDMKRIIGHVRDRVARDIEKLKEGVPA